eukprot:c2321_g1_i1.p2 GENE.c2321_g1_i1~~c2321_g1_i1.p2  ORF type:complete len:212 (-),score=36.33 c2321_g1_i1:295-930(-)
MQERAERAVAITNLRNIISKDVKNLQSMIQQVRALNAKENALNNALSLLAPDSAARENSRPRSSLALREHKQICQAHRIAGVSITKLGSYSGIRIHTAYNEHPTESYYLILATNSPAANTPGSDSRTSSNSHLKLHRHTVPYFIPVHALFAKHMPRSLRGFIRDVEAHLNAFVFRRESWNRARKASGNALSRISVTDSFDSISFTLRAAPG